MGSENLDEEGLLKNIQLAEFTLKISKLTFGWNNHSNQVKVENELMNEVRNISRELYEY